MSRAVVFRRAAQAELDEAVERNERQRAGRGVRFRRAVEKVLTVAAAQPDRYPVVFEDAREAAVGGFPYCVYYQVADDSIRVVAVFHAARDGSAWQGRL